MDFLILLLHFKSRSARISLAIILQVVFYRFWTINDRLSDDVCGRLVDIFKLLYSPVSEDSFLPSVVTLLLQACEKSNEFNQNIFPNPLSECVFQVSV